MQKVNLSEKLALFQEPWSPRVVAAVNDFHVKLVNTGTAGGARTREPEWI